MNEGKGPMDWRLAAAVDLFFLVSVPFMVAVTLTATWPAAWWLIWPVCLTVLALAGRLWYRWVRARREGR